jgi:phage baseplate assembly protein W
MAQGNFPQQLAVINPALGSDLAGVDDLSPAMTEVSGRVALAQSLARRLITPRGALIYDVNYGYDLNQWVNADVSQADIAQIQGYVRQEMLKDQRVISAQVSSQYVGPTQVTVAQTAIVADPNPYPTGVIVLNIQIQDSNGPFTLTATISSTEAQVIITSLASP